MSHTSGFSYGVFGTDGTVTHDDSQTFDASVTLSQPSWTFDLVPNGSMQIYRWRTNQPQPWSGISMRLAISSAVSPPQQISPAFSNW